MKNFIQSPDFLLTTCSVDLMVSRPLEPVFNYKPYGYILNVFTTALKGEILIDVYSCPLSLPKNYEIYFGETVVITREKINIGDSYLKVYPINQEIAQGESTRISPLFSVYSINQADNKLNFNEIESRTFNSGSWLAKRSVAQSMDVQLSGVLIQEDVGIYFTEKAHLHYRKVWFKLDDSQNTIEGFGYIKDFIKTRVNDRFMEVSFLLLIDGEVYDYKETIYADYILDDNYYYLLDENNVVVLVY